MLRALRCPSSLRSVRCWMQLSWCSLTWLQRGTMRIWALPALSRRLSCCLQVSRLSLGSPSPAHFAPGFLRTASAAKEDREKEERSSKACAGLRHSRSQQQQVTKSDCTIFFSPCVKAMWEADGSCPLPLSLGMLKWNPPPSQKTQPLRRNPKRPSQFGDVCYVCLNADFSFFSFFFPLIPSWVWSPPSLAATARLKGLQPAGRDFVAAPCSRVRGCGHLGTLRARTRLCCSRAMGAAGAGAEPWPFLGCRRRKSGLRRELLARSQCPCGKNKSPGYPRVLGTASSELVFSSPKWLTRPLPLKKFESLKSKRGRETLRRKGKDSGKSQGLIGNARYEGETSPLLLFPPPFLCLCSTSQVFAAMCNALPFICLTFPITFPFSIPSCPFWALLWF